MLQLVVGLTAAMFETVKRILGFATSARWRVLRPGFTVVTASRSETFRRMAERIRDVDHRRPSPTAGLSKARATMFQAVKRIPDRIRNLGRSRLRPVVGFVAGMTLIGGFSFIVWPLLSPAEPEARFMNGRLVGETTGWVTRVDHEGRVLQVSRSFFGFRSQEFIISRDATILIRDKEGGLGDLYQDMPIRVAWEKVGDTRRAHSIELVVGNSTTARAIPPPRSVEAPADQLRRSETTPAPPTVAPAPDSAPGPSPVARSESTSPAKPDSLAVAPSAHPALGAFPVARPELSQPPKPDSPAAAPMLDPSPATPGAPKGRRPGVARKPDVESVVPQSSPSLTDASALDGSDAIDWLLENSRRR